MYPLRLDRRPRIMMAEDETWQVKIFEQRFRLITGIEYLGNLPDYHNILSSLRARKPDMLFLDLKWDGLPDPNLTATNILIPALRREFQRMVLIAFTNLPDLMDSARRAGVHRVVGKRDISEVAPLKTLLAQFFFLPPEPQRLSARELEVLGWVARGLSNAVIGERSNLTEAGVKHHLRNIFQKLGATSRTEAVHLAHEAGLLDD